MADCELLKICVFFNAREEKYPVATARLKKDYCRGDNSGCARYLVYRVLGKEAIPEDLIPPQRARARAIIKAR